MLSVFKLIYRLLKVQNIINIMTLFLNLIESDYKFGSRKTREQKKSNTDVPHIKLNALANRSLEDILR
ncbi:hypothetical protein RB195_012547 [Necator americanus]|uniref:Uncharacterized protein n=1 Tax=Necator americanus TaxID=51031 RepID=A0ABR1DRD6_NECAM